MALRIEYIILLFLVVVLSSLFILRPDQVTQKESNMTTELVFESFTLIELNESGVTNRLSASLALKDKSFFKLSDVNVSYQNRYTLLAKDARYQAQRIYLNHDVRIEERNGSHFETQDLLYELKTGRVITHEPFVVKIPQGGGWIKGDNLNYNLKTKALLAEQIHAHLTLE